MWIMIISFIVFYFVLLVPFGIFVMGLLKVASIADDQSEQWAVRQGRDGQDGQFEIVPMLWRSSNAF